MAFSFHGVFRCLLRDSFAVLYIFRHEAETQILVSFAISQTEMRAGTKSSAFPYQFSLTSP